jgi:hypothetical protein
MTMLDDMFLKQQTALETLRGSYPVLDHLLDYGPVTRQSYLEFNYPDGVPVPGNPRTGSKRRH